MSDDGAPLGSAEALAAALRHLAAVIDARAGADPASSYTASLLAAGSRKVARKVSEEGGELALAIAAEPGEAVLGEAADLLFHMLVGLRVRGLSLDQVADVLSQREGVSGLAEKAARAKD